MTDFDYALMSAAFMAIFITVNPLSKVPFFIVLTDGYTKEQKKKVIVNSIKVSIMVLITFAVLGRFLFDLLNVGFIALEFVGALILIKIGYDMLMGHTAKFKSSEEEKQDAINEGKVGVVPLAIPMIAGPSAMITSMIYVGESSGMLEISFILFSILITCLITYVLLMKSEVVYERIGDLGITATLRIMGLLIASIGVQMLMRNLIEFAIVIKSSIATG